MARFEDLEAIQGNQPAPAEPSEESPGEPGIPEMTPEENASLQEALGSLPGDSEFQASVEGKLRELDARLQRVEFKVLGEPEPEAEAEKPPDVSFYPADWVARFGVRTAFIRKAPTQGWISYDNHRIPMKKGWVMEVPGNVYQHLVNCDLV